jgi:adenine-specific DNA-methyltransferase
MDVMATLDTFDLIVTSPPYNIGKEYEDVTTLDAYIEWQKRIIGKCVEHLSRSGSICWQVGNFIQKGKTAKETSIVPLDIPLFDVFQSLGLKLRNRIVWRFGHGLHCKHRFSGRYETILWFTKSDDYHFDLDAVRVPSKYPGKKHFKGPRVGELSGNPLGKNPEDVWDIPNVKHNHPEKTPHPCQFPVELATRFIRCLSPVGGTVMDPFMGSGSTGVACVKEGRSFVGIELDEGYVDIARQRIEHARKQTTLFT